jgi:hypothetical protein
VSISIDKSDVRAALDGSDSDDYTFEIRQAERIVNRELAEYTNDTESLELTGALVAAAYFRDDGDGGYSSVTQGSAQISWNNDDALSFWDRAVQMDPTGRLGSLEGDDFWCIAL